MLSEQEQIRRNSLQELYKLGINPYPQAAFDVNVKSIHAKLLVEELGVIQSSA